MRRIPTALLLAIVMLWAAPARADRVDDLCRLLTKDSSWRVRLQAAVVLGKLRDKRSVPALVHALSDENETVRGLSAQVLGEIGDGTVIAALERAQRDSSPFVRERAGQALGKIHPDSVALARPSSSSSSVTPKKGMVHVEIGGVGMKTRSAVTPELTARLRQAIIRELSRTPGLTLEGKPLSGFLIDSSITSVSKRLTDKWTEITVEISFVVGRLPSRAMVMMTSGGATVQAPRVGLKPAMEKSLEFDALDGAVQGAHENLLAFLRTQHQM